MRSTRRVALAVLAALPLAATGVGAAKAAPIGRTVVSKIDAGQPLINVGRRGGGGHGHGGHGGHGHGGHGGHGGHYGHGGHHLGHLHFGRGFYPGWYGVPYYYDYGPSYYDYYDDNDDDAVVYSESGDAVARCEARYRSFDRRSGTFLSTNGTRKLCPYLR